MNNKDARTPVPFKAVIPVEIERVATGVVNAAFNVHLTLGPGLLESVYEVCLARELELRGFKVERQVECPIHYADEKLDAGFRMDLVVEDCVIVELKAVAQLQAVHTAQVLPEALRLSPGFSHQLQRPAHPQRH